MLKVFDFTHELLVVLEKRSLALKFAFYQCLPDKKFTAKGRILVGLGDFALGVNCQAVKGSLFHRHHAVGFFLPMRLRIAFPD